MKQDIHPEWHPNATVTCVTCGTVWNVGSTMETIQTEACSQCHPFYTGQKRILDTTGRVERFKERMKKTQERKTVRKEKKSRPEVKKLG